MPAQLSPEEARAFIPQRTTRRVGLIWAQSRDGAIGKDGAIPWHIPEDMAFFRDVTTGHPVVMGRRTWDSIPERFRPFPGRTNIVLTSRADTVAQVNGAGGIAVDSVADALDAAYGAPGSEQVWVVGGSAVYAALEAMADVAAVTVVDTQVPDADAKAPSLEAGWVLTASDPGDAGWHESSSGLAFRRDLYERKA